MKRLLAAIAMWLHLSVAVAAEDPLDIPVRRYGFILVVALLGGFVSWIARVRTGKADASVMQLTGELTTSAFAGLLTFWMCAWANTPGPLMACLVGVSGHMGTKAIDLLEAWAKKRYALLFGKA